MSYKTILVHLDSEPRARALLEVAVGIAVRFEARLVGCFVAPPWHDAAPLPLPYGDEVARQVRHAAEHEVQRLSLAFTEMTRHQPVAADWRVIKGERSDPLHGLIGQAAGADLVVVSQADLSIPGSERHDLPARLALSGGRPVLVVPAFGHHAGVPRTVVIAWKPCREAARAVFDAVPLLRCADRVVLLAVAGRSRARPGADATSDIAAALARHDVKVEVVGIDSGDYTVAEQIRVHALEQGADLVVMGCYGHSRLSEHALGGVSRHMLAEMTVPILMSH